MLLRCKLIPFNPISVTSYVFFVILCAFAALLQSSLTSLGLAK
ncbi:hypothetical protein GPLA_4375 [Paraglaciecola polaris LMG 21857]|uniref:Uncharacterized protein n=1 Tax=Paraglaciecola polaris LMG 21857 TaxID=1129793 RepID=K6YRA3_9ALTE|nr:hypothetical protein GPLA_4375 [Paraglaciecola polaris LMG 21857]